MKNKTYKIVSLIAFCAVMLSVVMTFIIANRKISEGSNKSSNNTKVKIYDEKIDSIILKYYEGYNITAGDIVSNVIPINIVNLKDNDLEEIAELINELTQLDYSEDTEFYSHLANDYIIDKYMLEINKNFVLYMGKEYGIVKTQNYYFSVPDELYNKILKIVEDYNDKYLWKNVNSQKVTITNATVEYEITNSKDLETISNSKYYVIDGNDEDFANEDVEYILNLDKDRKLEIYSASVLGCIYYANSVHEYVYVGNLGYTVKSILESNEE